MRKFELTWGVVHSFLYTVLAIFSCAVSLSTCSSHLNTRPSDQTRIAVFDIISNSKTACLPRFRQLAICPFIRAKQKYIFSLVEAFQVACSGSSYSKRQPSSIKGVFKCGSRQRVYVLADYSGFPTSPVFHMGHKTRRDISTDFV